jgi:hypothetical protein
MPIGYLVTTGLVTACTFFALAPRRPRRSSPWNLSFLIGFLVNELPFIAFYWLLAATALALVQGDVDSPVGWVGIGLGALATAGLVVVVLRALRTGPSLDHAMNEGLGSGWRADLDPGLAARLRRHLPLGHILFAPFSFRRRDVERIANIRYGEAGGESARPLSPSLASFGLPDARPPARERSDPVARTGGASPHLSALEPRLGVHQRELPPGCRRQFPEHLIDVRR